MTTLFLFRDEDGDYLAINDSDSLEFMNLPRDRNEVKSLCFCTDEYRARDWLQWVKEDAWRDNPNYVPPDVAHTECKIVKVELP